MLHLIGQNADDFEAHILEVVEPSLNSAKNRVALARPARDVMTLETPEGRHYAILMLGTTQWPDEPNNVKTKPQTNSGLAVGDRKIAKLFFEHSKSFKSNRILRLVNSMAEFERTVLGFERSAAAVATPKDCTRWMALYDLPDFIRHPDEYRMGSALQKKLERDYPEFDTTFFTYAQRRWKTAREHLARGILQLLMPVEAIRATYDSSLTEHWRLTGLVYEDKLVALQRLKEFLILIETYQENLQVRLTERSLTERYFPNCMSFEVLRIGKKGYQAVIERQDVVAREDTENMINVQGILENEMFSQITQIHFESRWKGIPKERQKTLDIGSEIQKAIKELEKKLS